MFGILALISIILGLIVGAADVKILFDSLTWFVLAIAFNTLTVAVPTFAKKEA